ncbi:MAG: sigma 54-interacting transcriptional regulator [Negativicutes bacterium]|nr:sigma 54-interacting transcriptional regulator [Negativicutes bacterium]
MGKIICVIPYEEIAQIAESTFHEMNSGDWQIETILATGVQSITQQGFVADAIIARGVTAAALKRMPISAPVIDLPVSGYDIMRSIKVCREQFGARKIGVVGSHDMVYGAKSIEEIMDVQLEVVEVNDEMDAEPSIEKLIQKDIDALIGGVMSTIIARRLGLNAVYIQTGREAIYQALLEAKRAARIRKKEQERSEQFRAVLNYSSVGIIAVDAFGVINLVNTDASKLLDIRDEAIGGDVDRVLPELGLKSVLASGERELEEVKTVNGLQLAINKVPFVVDDHTIGAVATFQPASTIQELERKIRKKTHYRGHVARFNFGDIIGDSAAIKHVVATAREFSNVLSNVLIIGETGTGKEIFAQSIHNASSRVGGPFVPINCAALPENLLESELFGYADGAFTGAARGGKIGLFELAHHGTIFLDEISEMSATLQGRLLRVLQEREIMRLGDERVIPVDVRIIAATNRDLGRMMQKGTFRDDLYYRLDTLRLSLPPLREREKDIMALVTHFLEVYCLRSNKVLKDISPEAQTRLSGYSWPGNVRELRNIVERLVVLGKGTVISEYDVIAVLPKMHEARKNAVERANVNQEVLLNVLEQTNFHYGRAAAILGMSRTTLWRRLKQCELPDTR